MAILCPKCGKATSATETRPMPGGTRRRRRCVDLKCDGRVTTAEVPVTPGEKFYAAPVVISMTSIERLLRIAAGPIIAAHGVRGTIELLAKIEREGQALEADVAQTAKDRDPTKAE